MGVVFYREGNTHVVRGIVCEAMVLPHKLYRGKVPEGWYKKPEAINGLQEEEETEEEQERQEGIKLLLTDVVIDDLDNKELRIMARKCNIENWNDARFKTLRGKLKKCQQEI